jgi:competence protein ComEC
MLTAPAPPIDHPVPSIEPAWREFAQAPLVPVALSATLGLVVDRYLTVPFTTSLLLAGLALILWMIGHLQSAKSRMVWLWLAVGAIAAAHHHSYRNCYAADDIANFAGETPSVVRVRGTLLEEPSRFPAAPPNPLVSVPRPAITTSVLRVAAVNRLDQWITASGRVRLIVEARLDGLHAGDEVEVTGRLTTPAPPSNPGEWDYRSSLLDARITAILRVQGSTVPVIRLAEGWRNSLVGWLGVLRSWGTRSLHYALPESTAGLAAALVLGDTAALDRAEWNAYIRTGVIHVLAISGQHLAILAAFVWIVLRLCQVRRRHGAVIVAAIMIGYTLLSGARPSAIRAAVMVCGVCLAIMLRRPIVSANLFALAWLVIMMIRPTDPFALGCQLSLLSVFVLIWGTGRWLAPTPLTAGQQLIAETRTAPELLFHHGLHVLGVAFAVSLILATVNAPLILATHNVVSPIGVLLTPPLVLLTTVALIAGFLLLLVAPLGSTFVWPLARITEGCLSACQWLVHGSDAIPGAWVYAPAPAMPWVLGFYLGVGALVLLTPPLPQRLLVSLTVGVLLGVLVNCVPRTSDELRVTVLAVGHGCCVVIETPDGRTILYDAGSATGPETMSRVVAPLLWHRGIARIDELFLSHADSDHFNGLPELLKRFPIGRITHTPSFPDKSTPGVELALATIDAHRVPRREASAGDRFEAGQVTLEVIHPPPQGPPGIENVRSMVLLIRCAGHSILLTGDLEAEGQAMIRQHPIEPVDVLLAPHHGAPSANSPRLGANSSPLPGLMAAWAKPKLVVSSQRAGPTDHLIASYGSGGATVWDTPTAGAVIIRCHAMGMIAEAFHTGELHVVTRGHSRQR